MALLRRSAASELPESQVEFREESPAKRWLTLLVYLVLALAVAVLVVLAGRWVYHKVHNTSGPNPTAVTPQGSQNTLSSPNSSKNPAPAPTPAPSSSNAGNSNPVRPGSNPPTPNPTPLPASGKSTPAPSPSTLPNNGPGDMAALFIGSSLAGAALHYLVILRKPKEV
jgi:cytoskeletal protein RodZ